MWTKLVSIGLAMVVLMVSFNLVLADKPNPEATPPGRSEARPTPRAEEKEKDKGEKIDNRHGIFGLVKSIASDKRSLIVTTKDGAVTLDVTVTVTAATKIRIPTKRNPTIADIAVGDRVTVNGTPTPGGLVAKQIGVTPRKPTITHSVGIATAYTAGASITIATQGAKGKSETFTLPPQTDIRPKGTGIAFGDKVSIVARQDPGTTNFTATAIVVHPKDEDSD